jgi:hypothetical protein
MSDTPRTDAIFQTLAVGDFVSGEDGAKFLTNEVETMERDLTAARERIKRLEEAGDALCENSNPSRWDLPEAAALKLTEQSNWRKAKEAKP